MGDVAYLSGRQQNRPYSAETGDLEGVVFSPRILTKNRSYKSLKELQIELFEGSGKTMKHLKIRSLNELDEEKIIKLLKVVKET